MGLLRTGDVYGRETTDLLVIALAQDLVTFLVAVPLVLLLGARASRGSPEAFSCWLGGIGSLAYNYAIYAFSIQFGLLFLLWVAVLGLSTYALLGGLATIDVGAAGRRQAYRPLPLVGGVLVVVPLLFALLWLGEIVPDLLAARPSRSAALWRVPSNPVHVLDLAFLLPAVLVSGVALLRRRGLGYATAPGMLVLLGLTCLPILVTPLVAVARGVDPSWGAFAPVGAVLLVCLAALVHVLRVPTTTDAPTGAPPGPVSRGVALSRVPAGGVIGGGRR